MHAPAAAEIQIRDLPTATTAAVRVWRTFADLGGAFPEFLPRIAARITQLGGEIAGPPYARYHVTHGANVDVEIGAPIAAAIAGLAPLDEVERGDVGESALPGGRAAVMVHVGPYPGLGAAWQRVQKLLAEGELEPASPGWENYVDDPSLVPPDRLRTEIVIPIR
jgi:AraC family transcriptional regulator